MCRAIVFGLVALAIQVWTAHTAEAQISPGPLSKAHSTLDGPLNCTKCHAGGGASMSTRCLSCHKEIEALVRETRGLHARNARAECSSCHPDHAGRDFALVKWPDGSEERFDHAKAGWVLEGKHARLTCQKCHTAELRVSPIAALAPKRSRPGWTGLESSCASCHEDAHSGSLGNECQTCHNVAGWSPAPRFDHAKTDYALTGKHVDVTCSKCHVAAPRRANDAKPPTPKFKPLAHGDCVSCHTDPHQGRLKGSCQSCHTTTSSFSKVNDGNFSHDRTRYPLRGKHASVSCDGCHAGYPAKIDQPAFGTCATCHADPHRGKATLAGAAVDCASCHTLSGFTPATFSVAQHAKTMYPLEGKHVAVSCAGCHVRRDTDPPNRAGRGAARPVREVVMRPATDRCESCHGDAHGGQLPNRSCVSCHTVAGWKPSAFGVREHASLRLPLTGRHATVDCGSCHSEKRRGLPPPRARTLGKAGIAFALDETTCESCHRDPHGAKYTAAAQGQGGCTACHDTRAFHPSTVSVETHARFAFALEGAHLAAPCVACHTTMTSGALGASLKLAPSAPAVVYTIAGATCGSCHGTPHGDQFATRADGGSCQGCHDLRGWAPASKFVHEANGGFELGAAHEKVPCARCHVIPAGTRGGNAVRTWRGVPRACESCHRGDVKQGRAT